MEEHGFKAWAIRNEGCWGGMMDWTFWFLKRYGAMYESDYGEYTSGDSNTEGTCTHEDDKAVKIKDFMQLKSDPYLIRDELINHGPMSICISAGDKLFGYSSGVLEGDDSSWCDQWLNHAVALVGYTPGDTGSTKTETFTQCRRRWKADFPQCRFSGESIWRDRYCCQDVEREVETSDGVWKIQNSWATDWGEEGFVRVKLSGGDGWCGMNTEAYTFSLPDAEDD